MGIREEALALADELEAFEDGDCEECSLYGKPECKGHLSCMEVMARYAARKIREAVERDGEGENFGYAWGCMRPSDTTYRPDKVEPPAPKVLDADGVEIRVGDTVYMLGFGEPLTVKGFADDGRVLMSFHGENSLGYKPSKLTHEQPDTWERLEDDARQLDIYLNDTTDDYPRMSCCRDLVRRCRALVEKENRNE